MRLVEETAEISRAGRDGVFRYGILQLTPLAIPHELLASNRPSRYGIGGFVCLIGISRRYPTMLKRLSPLASVLFLVLSIGRVSS